MSDPLQALNAQKFSSKREEIRRGLPHLYGYDWYDWAYAFFTSKNRMSLLCAANQISKSSTQIRKCIEWCGNPKIWPGLWTTKPRQFWYLYPDRDTANGEWKTKWQEFMPAFAFKDHPTYGWTPVFGDRKRIMAVEFKSGITLYFKTYAQDVANLQSGTVHAIFCFPTGTGILTPSGVRPIEQIRAGEKVIAGDGSVQPVLRALSRESEVITRRFSNGAELTSTVDHPFWTKNRGWVPFSDLTPRDQCGTVRAWWLISSWSCLKASFLGASQRARTLVCGIISAIDLGAFFTSPFGRLCTSGASQRAMSFIIGTKTHSTIASRISNCSQEPSTHAFTRRRSGGTEVFGSLSASGAVKNSNREAQRNQSRGFARSLVGVLVNGASVFAAKLYLRLAKNLCSVSVLEGAPTKATAKVYNLTVAGPHTYFANGFLVHNCDEELPENLYSELNARLFGSDGYFSMVFTATLNQDFWKLAIEGKGEAERFPDAFKQQVSMYDCQTYRSGQPGAFTVEKIRRIEASCKSQTEILRRVHGRFVTEIGRKYPQFDSTRHYKKPFPIPGDWKRYAGVDIGGGGGGGSDGHAPAIAFVAVRPDNRLGIVYRGWRGDDGAFYTAGDVLNKFQDLRGNDLLTCQRYDQHSKDFIIIATRNGEPFLPSDKSHERGESIINTLFKNDMLFIFQDEQLEKLGGELTSLMRETPKRQSKDDFCDAMRYTVVDIPWDWSALKGEKTDAELELERLKPYTDEERVALEIAERRGEFVPEGEVSDEWAELEKELAEWQELAGGG